MLTLPHAWTMAITPVYKYRTFSFCLPSLFSVVMHHCEGMFFFFFLTKRFLNNYDSASQHCLWFWSSHFTWKGEETMQSEKMTEIQILRIYMHWYVRDKPVMQIRRNCFFKKKFYSIFTIASNNIIWLSITCK